MGKENVYINSVVRAIDILELLYKSQKEMGPSEISRELDTHKSTVYRTLVTLESKGFVYKNKDTGKYWLGLRLYAFGMMMAERMPLKNIIYPHLKELSDEYNEAANVAVLDQNSTDTPRIIILFKTEAKNTFLKPTPLPGSIIPSNCSAIGKCLLAFSPEGYLDKFIGTELKTYTENTISDWDTLLLELEYIREKGYSIDDEEFEIGLTCIAVPILDEKNTAIAAMSVSGPTNRMNRSTIEKLIKDLNKISKTVSSSLQ